MWREGGGHGHMVRARQVEVNVDMDWTSCGATVVQSSTSGGSRTMLLVRLRRQKLQDWWCSQVLGRSWHRKFP